jgi:hypothetical protein
VIDDKEGTGKTSLVRILEYHCKWRRKPKVPVSKVLLEDTSLTDQFALVTHIRNQVPDLPFTTFDQALISSGPIPVTGPVTGQIDNRDAKIAGGVQIGTLIQPQGPPTAIQEAKMRQNCVKGFFNDIKSICAKEPLVLLLDTYDKRQPALSDWIRDTFLSQLCFDDDRPAKLVVVLAGTELPDFRKILGDEGFGAIVRSRSGLTWEPQHVRDFLKANQFDTLPDDAVEFVCSRVAEGFSIFRALKLAEYIKAGLS